MPLLFFILHKVLSLYNCYYYHERKQHILVVDDSTTIGKH